MLTVSSIVLASVLAISNPVGGSAGAVAAHTVAQTPDRETIRRGERISVEVLGAGADVILIPGLASSREVWRAEANRLAPTHRVHLVQLNGFAGEPWDHGDAPVLDPAVDALADYVRDHHLDRPAVVGHSMGGLMALILAARHPDRVGRVVTVDSLPFFSVLMDPSATPDTARPFAELAEGDILSRDEASFRENQTRLAQTYARDPRTRMSIIESSLTTNRRAMATAVSELMTTDLRPDLVSIDVPVWAIYASDPDGGAPAAMADALWRREYATSLDVTLHRVDGARHFIMSDQPDRMSELMDDFLSR